MKNEKFYLGLDVGSDSVGWAATDEHYQLLSLNGKTAWGSRIFDEANDAKARRNFRGSGRRMQRRKYRIDLLNSLFSPLIKPIDDNFFFRLAESSYCEEDKIKSHSKYPIFGDQNKEKQFYKNYPTIWHLRAAQVAGKKEAFEDIRYVYMSIHHIIKYRGNFLSMNKFEIGKFDTSLLDKLNEYFKEKVAEIEEVSSDDVDYIFMEQQNYAKFIDVLKNTRTNKIEKKKEIKELLNVYDELKPVIEMFIVLIVGGSIDSTKVDESFEKISIQFNKKYDEQEAAYRNILGDYFSVVEFAKSIFDFISLDSILQGHKHLCDAFASIYNSHKIQLKALKKVVIEIDSKAGHKDEQNRLYSKIFKDENVKNNYASYVHCCSTVDRPASVQDFNKFIINELEPYKELMSSSRDYQMLIQLASDDILLQTISYLSTSVIPHQLHEDELVSIIDNASIYYPSLKDIKEKLVSLFRFRVPYYYGPLNANSKYSNVIRTSNDVITPWNIDSVVNKDETRQKFMRSLTNKCEQLHGENVLPFCSLYYQDFIILNKLNGIKLNGNSIDQKTKLELLNFIFSRKKTTVSQLEKFLKTKHLNNSNAPVVISGINENDPFINDMRVAFASAFDLSKDIDEVERIIYCLTVYTDNKEDAKEVIKKEFKLSIPQLNVVDSVQCKGWGNFSYKLLKGIKYTDSLGVVHSILDLLYDTTDVYMQILNNPEYNFKKSIDRINYEYLGNKTPDQAAEEILDEASPKMRRSVIQSLRIIDEVSKVAGAKPNTIAIEVTRTNKTKKEQVVSRKKELAKFLNGLTKSNDNLIKSQASKTLAELNQIELIKLKGKHLYLYFKQDGLDLYTGKPIAIANVINSSMYDTDHIIPQSLIKDDSLDNLVLVERAVNQRIKGDTYPIPESIRTAEIVRLWKILLEKGGISKKKYSSLIRQTAMSDEELQQFVSAQINVVNQSNILIRDVLAEKYKDSKIIFSKAEYPSYIRKAYNIPKLRDLNDTHHAVDAYLNIVTGTILQSVYGDMRVIKAKAASKTNFTYNMEKTLDRYFNDESLKNLVLTNCLSRHDFLLTYRISYQDSEFYEQKIKKAGKCAAAIPVHTSQDNPLSDVTKYGGYTGLVLEYHVVATISGGKKQRKILVAVPRLLSATYGKDEKKLASKLVPTIELKKGEVATLDLSKKIYPNQKVLINGCYYLLCTKGEVQVSLKPITPIYLDLDLSNYYKELESKATTLEQYDGQSFEYFTDKEQKNKFVLSKDKNYSLLLVLLQYSQNPIYDYCPMISKLRKLIGEEFKNEFYAKTIGKQYKVLESIIALYGRKSKAISSIVPNLCLKYKTALLSDEVSLINDSISGLYSNKVKI